MMPPQDGYTPVIVLVSLLVAGMAIGRLLVASNETPTYPARATTIAVTAAVVLAMIAMASWGRFIVDAIDRNTAACRVEK